LKKALTGLFFSSALLLTGCDAALADQAKTHAPILFNYFETQLVEDITVSKTRYIAVEMVGHEQDEIIYMTTYFFDFKIDASVLTFYAGGIIVESKEFQPMPLGGFIYESLDHQDDAYDSTLSEIKKLKKDEVGKGKDLKALNYKTGTLSSAENKAR